MSDADTELAMFQHGSGDFRIQESKVGSSSNSHTLPSTPNQPTTEDDCVHGRPSQEFSLPPVDSGKDAWLFLAACFVMEALIWGFPFAYGVFQEYYSTHPPFAGSSNIAVIGTCAMGIMYISTPLVFGILQRWPKVQRWSTAGGVVVMSLALALSSFSSTTTHLIVTQGVLYALGGCFAYSPCIMFMDQWFVKKIGLAYGIMWAGTGLAGIVVPIVLQWILSEYGFRTALRVWSICIFVLTVPLLRFIKRRVPIGQVHQTRRLDFSFITTSTFGILELCNIIEALGYFLPSIYLPSYARSLGASSFLSTLTVVLFNVASVFGCVFMGAITDRFHVTTCIAISTIGSTIGVFAVWGFSMSLGPLYVFCIIYGFFAGSYTSTWPGIMREVKRVQESVDPTMVFACLAAGRGIGNVASGPLSEILFKGMPWKDQAGFAYGSGYGPLIAFTGITALFGGASILGRRVGWV